MGPSARFTYRITRFRNSKRLAGRHHWPAKGFDANWCVVGIHDGDRRGLELRIVAGVAAFYLEQVKPGSVPNASRSFSEWFPTRSVPCARHHLMGTRLGGALAPPLAVALIAPLAGSPALAFWKSWIFLGGSVWRWFRDDPAKHPA